MAIFRPVRASENTINGMGYNEGYVYFAKDSGKIFLDVDNERKAMGGAGVSVFYAKDTNVVENAATGYFSIRTSVLMDETASPKEEDLILNIPDGGFYRVIQNEGDTLTCVRIAVSGSGSGSGGGSGGGDSGGSSGAFVTLTQLSNNPPIVYVHGRSYKMSFKATSTVDDYCSIDLEVLKTDGSTVSKTTKRVKSGSIFELDFGLALPKGSDYTIVVTASSDNVKSTDYRRYRGLSTLEVGIAASPDFNPLNVFGKTMSFGYVVKGSSGIARNIEVYIDGSFFASEEIPKNVLDGQRRTIMLNSTDADGGILISHGTHTVEAKIVAKIDENTEIETEPLTYELVWAQEGVDDAIIWCPYGYPESIVQYEPLNIEFLVYQPGKNSALEVTFLKSGELVTTRSLAYNSTSTHLWNITDYDIGPNEYAIQCGNAKKTFAINVEEDTSRDMGIVTSGLVLNLDAAGRSNSEYPSSRTTWKSAKTSETPTVEFNNFNWYNNGWLSDSDGTSFLRVSNGASIRIPIRNLGTGILNANQVTSPLGFEFRFRVRNVTNYETLVSGSEADSSIAWAKYGVSFALGAQEAFIKSSNTIANAQYKEDEIITVSFAVDQNSEAYPLLYIYINGILTGISKYGQTDTFNAGSQYLEINSNYCDVDIYKIRVYQGNKLSAENVVQNQIADTNDVEAYDVNQIVENVQNIPTISFEKLEAYNKAHPEAATIPYMIIESADGVLPFVKGGKKVVDITFVNPALDYAYEQGLIDEKTYLQGAPSFVYKQDWTSAETKGSLDVQGTSSQGYPRRNFKWKAKQKDATWKYTNGPLKDQAIYEYDAESDSYKGSKLNDVSYKKYRLDSEIGETTFCLKADYMESSGTYNTGFASFVKTTYDKHPLRDYGLSEADTKKYRTTVYGFPIIVFSKHPKTGVYEFVGRYNFNLDKGANSSYGFEDSHNSKVKDSEGNYLPFEKVAECWEFTNNQGGYCSFALDDFAAVSDSSYTKTTVTADTWEPNKYYLQQVNIEAGTFYYTLADGEFNPNASYFREIQGTLKVNDSFEYRYHCDEDLIDDCLDDENLKIDQNEKNRILLEKYKNLKEVYDWLHSTSTAKFKETTGDPDALESPETFDGQVFTHDTKEYRLAKFKDGFEKYFDKDYCVKYAIMTEFFHLYDSRGKNMMLATWGPQEEGGHYIWYPIFYDIDTQLGINNSGEQSWGYDAEPTRDNQFSTSDSVLWNNLYEVYLAPIKSEYDRLRSNGALSITQINAFYNSYPIPGYPQYDCWKDILNDEYPETRRNEIMSYARIGKKPLMLYNVDEYFKYIAPSITGYTNTVGSLAFDDGGFFYALQGTRELSRYLYLRNRFNYVDSMWQVGNYKYESLISSFKYRANANLKNTTSDKFLLANGDTPADTFSNGFKYTSEQNALDANFNANIKTSLRSYAVLYWDSNLESAAYSDGENSVELKVGNDQPVKETPDQSQQLFYIGGPEYISDLGDLSTKYFNEFVAASLDRLESLNLGSDAKVIDSDLGEVVYQNSELKSMSIPSKNMPLLKKVLLNGVDSYVDPLDLSGSEKLEELRALRTNFSGFIFADGVQLKTLHLPASTTSLKLVEPTSLVTVLDQAYDDPTSLTGPREGLYLEGLTNKTNISPNDVTHLNNYSIDGGNFGYGSYEILKKLVDIKTAMINNSTLSSVYNKVTNINLTDVDWTPYKQVVYGEPFNATKTYYQDNKHFGFAAYTEGESGWEFNTSNGYLYEYVSNEKSNIINSFDVLKTFVDNYKAYTNNSQEQNYFTDSTGKDDTVPYITGTIYVDNSEIISEAEIANDYLAYFPNLKIFAKNVQQSYSSQFVTLIDGKETEVYFERFAVPNDGSSVTVNYPSVRPSRFNYDFAGWSLTPEGEALDQEELEALAFSNENKTYKFYAVWSITIWNINYNSFNPNTKQEATYKTDPAPAGSYIPDPNIIPVSPLEAELPLEERYRFIGWTTDKYNSYHNDAQSAQKYIVDVTKIMSENTDRIFYAIFVREDVHETALEDRYLTVVGLNADGTLNREATVEYTLQVGDVTHIIPAGGVILKPKDGIQLAGKITLPTTFTIGGIDYPVYQVSGFDAQTNLTHIFWKGEDNLRAFRCVSLNAIGAFSNCTNLKYVEIPSTVIGIDNYSFINDTNLDVSGLGLYEANNLKVIGMSAFNGTSIFDLQIPGAVEAIGTTAFAYCGNTAKGALTFGGPGDPSQLKLVNSAAFTQNNYLGNDAWLFSEVTVYYDPSDPSRKQFLQENIEALESAFGGSASINYLTP